MENRESRRRFLAAAGATAVGIGCGVPLLSAIGSEPVTEDSEGPRWAMVVDTRKCAEAGDCDACTAACHGEHNVPDIGTAKEEVKWLWKEPYEKALPGQEQEYMRDGLRGMPTLVLCNHCDNPPCTKVCPTQSTWKREDGVVMMDMHRCIGCRYCIVACPYGSRSFNWRDPWPREEDGKEWPRGKPPNPEFPTRMRGVVEKCNFCAERLAEGGTPACVEACECGALVFGDITKEDSEVRKLLASDRTIRRKPGLGTNPHVFYIV